MPQLHRKTPKNIPAKSKSPPPHTGPGVFAFQQQRPPEPTCDARCEAAEQRENDHLVAQQTAAKATQRIADISFWQILVGAGGIGLLIITLYFTRKSTRAAIVAAESAGQASEVAKIALTGLEIPHLFVDAVEFDRPLLKESFDYENEQRYSSIHYGVKNYGRSPAVIKEFAATAWKGVQLPETPQFIPADLYGADDEHVIGAGESRGYRATIRFPITGQLMNDLGIDTAAFYIFGYIKYESIFGQDEVVGYCWRYNLNINKFLRQDIENYTYRNRESA